METVSTYHLVRNEDLNHHNTLFAGRIAEWMVETGYITATEFLQTNNVVCVNIHDIQFKRPVHCGEVVHLNGTVVRTGHSSLTVNVCMIAAKALTAEGVFTFVHVDETGRAKSHGRSIITGKESEKMLKDKPSCVDEK